MRIALLALLLTAVVAASGCASETGDIISFRDPGQGLPEENLTPEGNESQGIPNETSGGLPPVTNESLASEARDPPEPDTCVDELCDDSVATCPDGEVVSCQNLCDPETGMCTSCIPDCSGHLRKEEQCLLECGGCKSLDQEACECVIMLYCDGNHICEPSNGEWPSSPDCSGFGSCDDLDPCTQDTFDPNQQECVHTDICCDDQDDCTVDFYNYSTGECTHSYVCCGNGQCQEERGEDQDTCPEDCMEEGESVGDVAIVSVDHEGDEEMVTLEGYGIELTGWSIEDDGPYSYSFPEGFVINGVVYLHTIGCATDNNQTDLYWGKKDDPCRTGPVWTDTGDTATLRNASGDVVDTYSYPE